MPLLLQAKGLLSPTGRVATALLMALQLSLVLAAGMLVDGHDSQPPHTGARQVWQIPVGTHQLPLLLPTWSELGWGLGLAAALAWAAQLMQQPKDKSEAVSGSGSKRISTAGPPPATAAAAPGTAGESRQQRGGKRPYVPVPLPMEGLLAALLPSPAPLGQAGPEGGALPSHAPDPASQPAPPASSAPPLAQLRERSSALYGALPPSALLLPARGLPSALVHTTVLVEVGALRPSNTCASMIPP